MQLEQNPLDFGLYKILKQVRFNLYAKVRGVCEEGTEYDVSISSEQF